MVKKMYLSETIISLLCFWMMKRICLLSQCNHICCGHNLLMVSVHLLCIIRQHMADRNSPCRQGIFPYIQMQRKLHGISILRALIQWSPHSADISSRLPRHACRIMSTSDPNLRRCYPNWRGSLENWDRTLKEARKRDIYCV